MTYDENASSKPEFDRASSQKQPAEAIETKTREYDRNDYPAPRPDWADGSKSKRDEAAEAIRAKAEAFRQNARDVSKERPRTRQEEFNRGGNDDGISQAGTKTHMDKRRLESKKNVARDDFNKTQQEQDMLELGR